MTLPTANDIDAAVDRLASRLLPVESERLPLVSSAGRVLTEDLLADRPSPAADVSAMDGYAMRLQDVDLGAELPVRYTNAAGHPPRELESKSAVRIFTGAPVPAGADLVVKREDTRELEERIELKIAREELQVGTHIRRRGENIEVGECVLGAGSLVHSAAIAGVASFGPSELLVRRKIKVAVLNTGDELARPGESVADWQIRDSNGPTLQAWLQQSDWVSACRFQHVGDGLAAVERELEASLRDSDAVILTGGVSMGDTDYVPQAIENIGGQIVFHRLPLRPGKPVLGAVRDGKLILGLPGNPVSVAVTSRVIGRPLLHRLAGISTTQSPLPRVSVADLQERSLHLVWYRLVDCLPDGSLQFSATKGSGDLVSLSRSAGFVEIPAGHTGDGPWRFYAWE